MRPLSQVLVSIWIGSWVLAGSPSAFAAERTKVIMGTYVSIELDADAKAHATSAFQEMERLDAILSTYKPESEVSRLNDQGYIERASPELREILLVSQRLSRATSGYFDATIGALSEGLYGFRRLHDQDAESLPEPKYSKSEISAARKSVGSSAVVIEGEKVRFTRPGLKLDFGGIGKGYAVDAAAKILASKGVTSGRIAMSGDIRCLSTCKVEIADPFREGAALGDFETVGAGVAISTSGTYRRYLKDPKHNHLIDPKSGRPQKDFASVTLVARGDNARLDALTTAVAVMPQEKALRFLQSQKDLAWVLVRTSGEKIVSPNLGQFGSGFRLRENKKADRKIQPRDAKTQTSKSRNPASFK